MQERVTPEAMRLRRSTVEHPFATIKYRIFGHPRLLMRGLSGARVEIGLATTETHVTETQFVMQNPRKLDDSRHSADSTWETITSSSSQSQTKTTV
jgi:hypothetical protein